MSICPLYDNGSSLCAYVKESGIKDYLGNDIRKWNSLVVTKSKSIIRISCEDEKRPTHLKVIEFLRKNYYKQTITIEKKIETLVTEEAVYAILDKYQDVLTEQRINLIGKYILSKVQLLRDVFKGKET